MPDDANFDEFLEYHYQDQQLRRDALSFARYDLIKQDTIADKPTLGAILERAQAYYDFLATKEPEQPATPSSDAPHASGPTNEEIVKAILALWRRHGMAR